MTINPPGGFKQDITSSTNLPEACFSQGLNSCDSAEYIYQFDNSGNDQKEKDAGPEKQVRMNYRAKNKHD